MTQDQDAQLPEVVATDATTLLELIDDAQRRKGWTDEDLEGRLGLKDARLMTLLRQGVVRLSFDTALKIETHLYANVLEVLQVFTRERATDTCAAVIAIYHRLTVGQDIQRIVDAYQAIVDGDERVSSIKLPYATVWVMPDGMMKGEHEDAD